MLKDVYASLRMRAHDFDHVFIPEPRFGQNSYFINLIIFHMLYDLFNSALVELIMFICFSCSF